MSFSTDANLLPDLSALAVVRFYRQRKIVFQALRVHVGVALVIRDVVLCRGRFRVRPGFALDDAAPCQSVLIAAAVGSQPEKPDEMLEGNIKSSIFLVALQGTQTDQPPLHFRNDDLDYFFTG